MIVIVSYENYPDGSPGAIRNRSFAEAFAQMGKEVVIIHKGNYSSSSEDVSVESLYHDNRYNKLLFFAFRTISKLKQLRKMGKLDAVVVYSAGLIWSFWLIKWWCLMNKIVFVCDVVEWYSPEQFKNGKFSPNYIEKDFMNRIVVDHRCRVIAISRYLEQYFASKGCPTVRIPIIFSQKNVYTSKPCDIEKRSFIYAGSHLKMDNIPLILRSLLLLSEEERKKISFHIFGMTNELIDSEMGEPITAKLGGSLKVYGRRPNSEVLECYQKADFCVMFRNPVLRVNRAGFPSKVIESMLMGVPVFCNISSDLGDFLKDGDNAVVTSLSAETIAEGFRKILAMTYDEVCSMKDAAKQSVENHFSYKNYVSQFEKITQ